jgi:hypothetical protein
MPALGIVTVALLAAIAVMLSAPTVIAAVLG